jgi:hypothetical protein
MARSWYVLYFQLWLLLVPCREFECGFVVSPPQSDHDPAFQVTWRLAAFAQAGRLTFGSSLLTQPHITVSKSASAQGLTPLYGLY